MAKKPVSVRIEEDLLNMLDGLIPGERTTTYKLEALIEMNKINYNKAMKSLIGKFSYLETCYMVQAFNGTIIQRYILDTASYLYRQVDEFYAFGSEGFITDEEIDVESLLNKLEDLTDYQALAIINCIEELRNDSERDIEDLVIVARA